MTTEPEPNYIIKICLLGEANVGKTSLVYRFIENKFKDNYKSTLGVNLLKVGGQLLHLKVRVKLSFHPDTHTSGLFTNGYRDRVRNRFV